MGLTAHNRRRRLAAARSGAALAAAPDASVVEIVEPPREGRGSGKGTWAKFAAEHGVTFADDATREDIIAAYDELVAANTAKLEATGELAAAAEAGEDDENADEDGDDAQTAEAGAGDGSEQDEDDSTSVE